jgi:DNA-binding CsgD family transcriptional regulator
MSDRASPALERLRALVRGCDRAVGLVALRGRSFVALSPAAVACTGLSAPSAATVDLAVLTEEPSSVRQTLGLVEEGVLEACRLCTTLRTPGRRNCVHVSLRVVARDADEAYAIALFSTADPEVPSNLSAPYGAIAKPAFDEFVGSLADLADPDWPIGSRESVRTGSANAFQEFGELTDRQREILTRLARGDRVATISRGMHLAASTVRNYLTALYRKIGVHSQAELIEHLHASRRP